jgi:hypothetical protein
MSLVFRHTLLRRRSTGTTEDRHGNAVSDWSSPDELPIPGWAVDAGDTTQDLVGRDGSTVAYTVRKKGLDVDVTGSDRLVLFGEEFPVYGDVLRQPGATDATSHTIVRLIRAEG